MEVDRCLKMDGVALLDVGDVSRQAQSHAQQQSRGLKFQAKVETV